MNIKRLIGYILLSLLFIGVLVGVTCIFHYIGDFSIWQAIGYTTLICVSIAVILLLIAVIGWLISD